MAHKVYPLAGVFMPGIPHVVTEVETKKEAEALIATGAFTDNPNDPRRIPPAEAEQPAPAGEKE
jgi:hypothetical protein